MKLDKTKVYSLKDLTSEEKQQLLEKLRELDDSWTGRAPRVQLFSSKYLYYTNSYNSLGGWFVSYEIYYTSKEIINAKELFYTLENVQVDCRYLTNDQIDEIADVFKKYGYRIGSLFLMEEYCFIRENKGKYCLVTTKDKNKTKITYEKFMELFASTTAESTQPHYDNTNGSIYKFCNDQKLNAWEFDIIKRVVRCRKKGLFKEDLQKTKDLIDLYLKEFKDEK